MEIRTVIGFAILFAMLLLGFVGMFVLGRRPRRRRRPYDVGHGGDGGAWIGGGDGGSYSGHSGGHSDGGGHGGH